MNRDDFMITARWKDGRRYSGATCEEVVEAMLRGSPFTELMDTALYMRAVSIRALMFRGSRVRTEDAVSFLHDLERMGYITIVPQG